MPFSNPILAGETLVVPGMQSDGYVAGTTGWRIERAGNADFNDVDMRGTLDIVGPDYPPAGTDESRIRILVAGFRPVIQLDDSFGRTYEIGADDNALYFKALASPNSRMAIVHDLGLVFRSDATGAPSVLFDDADGYLKRGSYAPWTVETWREVGTVGNPAWQNSFGNFGAPWETVAFKKNVLGHVEFRGSATRTGTTPNGTTMFTLPVGYRPANDVVIGAGTLNGVAASLWVRASGLVQCVGQSAVPGNTSVGFDGCSFSLI